MTHPTHRQSLHALRSPRARMALVATLLCVLVGAPAPLSAAADDGYVVQDGDTLGGIADAHGFTVEQLVWLNGIEDPDLIFPGEIVALPEAAVEASSDAWDAEAAPMAVDSLPPWVDPETIRADLVIAADKWEFDPYLIMALAWQESGWRQDEVSNVGAIGVMQIMPATAASLNDWLFERDIDPWNNVWDNIDAGVAFLEVLWEETHDIELTIGSYYQGLGSVQSDGFFPDTRAYVDNILYMRDLFAAGELP